MTNGQIAYLGPAGTFTHQAALAQFGRDAKLCSFATITDVFAEVDAGRAAYGVVPIENSTEGVVTDSYDLFAEYDVVITAEIRLHIHHHLASISAREQISVLYSHPQVFGQCRNWLHAEMPGCETIDVNSTTAAAERAAKEAGAGALVGSMAAERYNLPVLEENIEDLSDNVTRFLVLGKSVPAPSGNDRTSLMLAIQDRVGALYDALLPFKDYGVNLTLIHSRPSKQRNWDYFFFIDIAGHLNDENNRQALDEVSKHCKFVKHLGSYPKAGD
jgi:chorismate mutase/prephenate dehydratase